MNVLDVFLLILHAVAVVLAVRKIHTDRKMGKGCLSCGGNCRGCNLNCAHKKEDVTL